MRSHALLPRLLPVLLLALAWAPAVAAADVTVFAAASLKEALDEQSRQFGAASGNKVVISYGGSNALARRAAN
jgi:molybdate transport system substrate-binding protein